MNYLEWINQCTPTRWWHDSGNPAEIDLALKRGATGVTTNPVLTFRSFTSEPDFWTPKVLALGDDFPTHRGTCRGTFEAGGDLRR